MNEEKFSGTYIKIRSSLARIVSRIVPPKEIEDIVQETYVRACEADKVRKIRTPRAFLYKTARNLAFDYMKKAETRLGLSDTSEEVSQQRDELGRADETFDQVCSGEEFSKFCEAVRHLPIECRKTFVLKKVYGFSQK
jgi:RNA polymerase sigma-70 factor (ECF subfamily)